MARKLTGIQKRVWADGAAPKFVARVTINGRERSKSFDREKDAKAWRIEQLSSNPIGVRTDNQTVGAVLKRHIAAMAGKTDQYQHLLQNLGDLEYLKMADVQPDHVKAWKGVLLAGRPWKGDKPLAESTVNTMLAMLSALFNASVDQGQLSRNPVKYARRKASGDDQYEVVEPHQILTVAQVGMLVRYGFGEYETMLRLGAVTGLRAGEMAGLRPRSVDFDRKCIHVVEQADGRYRDFGWKSLKTKYARRTLPVPDHVLDLLLPFVERDPLGPLFLTRRSGQWSPSHIAKHWRNTAEAARIEGHSWHSLRHFYASALIYSGASVTTVQKRLGHASPQMTLRVYSHLWPGEDDRTREVLDGLSF